jgi:hypothetical protein
MDTGVSADDRQPPLPNGTNLLQTALAKPYYYRRSGRYYLRLRPQGNTTGFFTLSLRTADKAIAMTISKDILKALGAFHLDNPSATWDELRERLIDIAEECLTLAHGDDSLVAYQMVYDELRISLREASAKGPFTIDQQHAASRQQTLWRPHRSACGAARGHWSRSFVN